MKVYTKTGDQGQTSLFSKERVFKDHLRVEAYGTVDEASAAMGLAKSLIRQSWAVDIVQKVQVELIALNADLATEHLIEANYHITQQHVAELESIIDSLEQKRIPQHYFVIPGACTASAALDLARTMVRRTERCVVKLKRTEEVTVPVSLYLNRLSDLLFVLARCVEQEELIVIIKSKVLSVLQGQTQEGINKEYDSVLSKAKIMIEAAEKKALEIGVPMVIAVVDMGGNLVAQHRMDGSLLASISISLDKAYTAVALKISTNEAAAVAGPGQPLFGLNTTDGGRLVVFGGGFPIVEDGIMIGGFGVSGGSVDEDMTVAKAGLAACK
ncbi:cob(I)yrinic acid a,c-diamide adenosyltransferase [Pelosinus sp. sgz500959]|uniref:cob(I)yrinic acid a,c-diamide adenosyltransferase n=1 Tax=Pelosinus sp. sgz500959 TaxID=3242472 RepID=UPI00366BE392